MREWSPPHDQSQENAHLLPVGQILRDENLPRLDFFSPQSEMLKFHV